MKEIFRMNHAWVIGLAFLSLIGFAGDSAHAYCDVERTYVTESVAEGYCESAYVPDLGEEISSVSHTLGEDRISFEVKVSLTGCDPGGSFACWLNIIDNGEHIRVWIDWNENGRFGRGSEESSGAADMAEESSERIADMSEPIFGSVEEDGSITLTFEDTCDMPEGHAGTRRMRIAVTSGNTAGYSCDPLGFGDVRDYTVTFPDILMSSNSVDENMPEGTEVGIFSVADGDSGSDYAFSLVSGEGNTDNGTFITWKDTSSGTWSLNTWIGYVFDYENDGKVSYSIRVKAEGETEFVCEKQFTITVSDTEEFYISGRIEDPDTPGKWVGGVTMYFSYEGRGSRKVTTDDSGYYSQVVNRGWSGTVEPGKTGYKFDDPPSRSYENVTSDEENQDYTAKGPRTVSGSVYKVNSEGGLTGIGDVELNFSNNSCFGDSALTNREGYFSKKVRNGWSGRVTPKKGAYAFEPSDFALRNVTEDMSWGIILGFTGTAPEIKTGLVFRDTGEPFEGVTVDFSDGGGSALTDSSGLYRLPLRHDWDGAIMPNRTGYTFKRHFPFLSLPIYIAEGPRLSGVRTGIYAEDSSRLSSRSRVCKAPGDLIDIVVRVTNDAVEDQKGLTLTFRIASEMVAPEAVRVYFRRSQETLTPFELPPYAFDDSEDGRDRTVTIDGFSVSADEPSAEFVLRFRLPPGRDNFILDARAEVSGDSMETSSARLGGTVWWPVVVASGMDIVITNRELTYRTFGEEPSRVSELWQSLYEIAEGRGAVICHVDKYDRGHDGDREDNVTVSWFDDRTKLAHGSGGSYGYDDDPESDGEEALINQAAIKVKELLRDLIDRSGGLGKGRHVAILGGDSVIPFYRAFDPTETVLKYKTRHKATGVTLTDAKNNYLFTDMFYRDYNGEGWKSGEVENLFVGRILGTSPENMRQLLLSGNGKTHSSTRVVKLEMNERNCLLDTYEEESEKMGYEVVRDIDGTDLDVPQTHPDDPETALCPVSPGYSGYTEISDPARWDNDFYHLFTGLAENVPDFDVMRLMCHGTVTGVQGSRNDETLFIGTDIRRNAEHVREHFSSFRPFFIFDSCMTGLADGKRTDILLNALLPLGVRGVTAASGITWQGKMWDSANSLTDKFYSGLLSDMSAGEALVKADRHWFDNPDDFYKYAKLEINLFGLPWVKISPPLAGKKDEKKKRDIRNGVESSDTIISESEDTYIKSATVDVSNYEIVRWDEFDLVEIPGFEIGGVSEPIIPSYFFSFHIPDNAEVDNVGVTFGNSTDLGKLDLPALYPADGTFEYGPCPDDLGVFPPAERRYSYSSGYGSFDLMFYPMIFDTGTKETTLYETIDIEVTYTTPDKGVVTVFRSDSWCGVGEEIRATAVIENTSADAHEFELTVEARDALFFMGDNVYGLETASGTIESNTTGEITVRMAAPDIQGVYKLLMTVSDGTRIIRESERRLETISGRIISFKPPKTVWHGVPNVFPVVFKNLSGTRVNAVINLSFYKDGGDVMYPAAWTPWVAEVEAGETKEIRVLWVPPAHLFGEYDTDLTVTVGDDAVREPLYHSPVHILPLVLGDAVRTLGFLAGTYDGHPYGFRDVSGDGKIGTEDAVLILQAVAGVWD